MRRELDDKDEVIASLKVVHDTLKKLSDDKKLFNRESGKNN